MNKRFVPTLEAAADLRDILLDIAEDSPDTAERLRGEFRRCLERLGQSPGIGHFHKELLESRDRFWNFYSYVIAYRWGKSRLRSSPLCKEPAISPCSSACG